MNISSNNSNSISLIAGKEIQLIDDSNYFEIPKGRLSCSEKRKFKGMVKSFLGMAYFVTLMYFLFVLLT
jgi:hypothetical protein